MAALKASVFFSVRVMALWGQKTTGQPVEAHRWDGTCSGFPWGPRSPPKVGVFPTLRHHVSRMHHGAGAQSMRPDGATRSRHCPHCGPGRCSGRSATTLWNWSLTLGVTPGPDACTANHGDVKAGAALALPCPLLAEHPCWHPPAQPAQTAILLGVSNLNAADFLIFNVNLELILQHQRQLCPEIYRIALVLPTRSF